MAHQAPPLLAGLGKMILLLTGTGVALYALLCAWVYATQRAQIYFPTPERSHPHARALWLDSEGARIKIWTVSRPGPRAMIYFGGNADDAAGHVDAFARALPDHSLYLVNYRGYGGSTGRPSESALVADALAAYDHVRQSHPDVSVVGRSLGGGVAVQLAEARPLSGLVLVTPFDSLVDLARTYFGWLPVGLLLRDRYESARRAAAISAPVLVVIAGDDEIVPRARAVALASAFRPGQVQVVVVPGVGHNTLDLSPQYLGSVRSFLADR